MQGRLSAHRVASRLHWQIDLISMQVRSIRPFPPFGTCRATVAAESLCIAQERGMLHTFYRQELLDLAWSEPTRTIAKRWGFRISVWRRPAGGRTCSCRRGVLGEARGRQDSEKAATAAARSYRLGPGSLELGTLSVERDFKTGRSGHPTPPSLSLGLPRLT
jgi:hypothetical protein